PAAVALGLFVLGAFCSVVPAAVARGAGEMERPIASSWAWSALALGAGVGLAWSALAWWPRHAMNERSFSDGQPCMAPPFTPEHELFRKTLRDYVVRELAPHALEWDEAGIFPREVFRDLAQLGALGVNYPEEVGGSGGDFWHVVV